MTVGTLVMLVSAVLAMLPPLTESQREQLADAQDRSPQVDEPAFYALLENASQAEPITSDLSAIIAQPQVWRGREVYLTGQLASIQPVQGLPAPGWEGLELWTLRDEQGQPVLVYLTDPPAVEREPVPGQQGQFVPSAPAPHVALLVRFYKLITLPSQGGGARTYPAFVGKGVLETGPVEPIPDGTPPLPLILIALVGLVVVYGLLRALASRRRRARREASPWMAQATEDETYQAGQGDLPTDPAEALERLQRRKHEEG